MQSDTGVVRAAAAVAESSGSGGVLHDVAKSTIALFLTTSVATISMGDIIMMVPMGVELQPLVESKESYGRRRHKAVFGLFKPPCFFLRLLYEILHDCERQRPVTSHLERPRWTTILQKDGHDSLQDGASTIAME